MYHKLRGAILAIGLYEVVAFVSGFVLMAYELAASRILAPSIGSSIFVWTSVIGTMIAALAIGYWAGGWLADKRVAKQDVAWLLLASAAAVVVTLVFYEPVLGWVTAAFTDVRLQSVVATSILFLPASFLLGMISPYLVRLRVRSVATTGRSVASLSALNSIGGIVGTFFAGFVFFSWFGSRETLVLLAVLLAVGSWLILPRYRFTWRAGFTTALVVIAAVQLAAPAQAGVVAQLDTPSAHYTVRDTTYAGRPTRVLATGPNAFQSGIYLDDSRELAFPYTRKMAQIVDAAAHKEHILVLGGGVFTLPEYLAKQYPASQVDVVEIDPQLENIAEQYFSYTQPPNVHIYAQDARIFLEHTSEKYDIILVDVYNDNSIPFSLATRGYTAQLERALQPNGVVVANIIAGAGQCMPLLASIDGSYRMAFSQDYMYQVSDFPIAARQNLLGIYSNQPLPWVADITGRLQVDRNEALRLTDNHAPLEPLWQQCGGVR